MIKGLKRLPKELYQSIKVIGKLAERNGYPAFLVGGYVRDLLLRVDNFDIDIVVEKNAIALAKKARKHLDADIVVHKRFGTATLSFPRPKKRGQAAPFKIDFATARSENYEEPAALPKVSFASIREDLFRRDFTINAMAIKINKSGFGKLIDYFGGKDDLKQGLIRTLHNLSFLDDPTRILRAIRFEQRYGFKIEPLARALIKRALKFNIFSRLNKERIKDEIVLIFKELRPEKYVQRLNKLCGLKFICPKLKIDANTIKLMRNLRSEIRNFEKEFPLKRALDKWIVYFMVFIEKLKLRDAVILVNGFGFRRGESKRILSYFSLRNKMLSMLKSSKIKQSSIFKFLEPLSYEVIITLLASARDKKVKRKIKNFLSIHNGIRLSVTGSDLKNLGLKPGPYFKNILNNVLYKKIDGGLSTREEELQYLKKVAKRYGDRSS